MRKFFVLIISLKHFDDKAFYIFVIHAQNLKT